MDVVDAIPPAIFQGLGVITMFALSWWWLMRGFLHTDREFQAVVTRAEKAETRAETVEAALNETLDQQGTLIEANAMTARALDKLTGAKP